MPEIIDHEAHENSPKLKPYYDNKRQFCVNTFWLIFGGAAAAFGLDTAQSLMPLHMAKVGLDAEQISLAMAMRGWLGMPLVLYIAHLSDHWQGKMGRRLPFVAISLPFIMAGMAFFPYMRTVLSCLLMYTMFTFFVGIKFDAYPFLAYDISRKRHWGRINGANVVFGSLGVWLGQRVLMPMVDTHGEKYVYLLGTVFVFVATALTLLFLKEPPFRSEQKPKFNPVPVLATTLSVGFRDWRHIWVFLAFALTCGFAVVQYYIPLQGKVNLGMTEGEIGKNLLQYGTMAGMVLAFFMGWAGDGPYTR